MNERIEKLAEQAMDEMDPESFSEDVHIPTEWYQKFAELIAKECMTIAKNWEDQLENANSLSESNAVGIVAYRIARQFGVEE